MCDWRERMCDSILGAVIPCSLENCSDENTESSNLLGIKNESGNSNSHKVFSHALTRNRITFMYPPNPGTLDFTGFSEGSKAKNQICSPHQFSPKSEVFFGGQMLR